MTRKKFRRPEAVRFGGTVRRLRELQGLTQEDLGDLAEISATYVGFIERGDSVPTLTIVLQIAKALKVKPGELLGDF
ncbi:MAG: helix-turn-helix transcriptional regulator [Acidobacteriota bacterium]